MTVHPRSFTRLRVIEDDSERGRAKVRYIGYGAEWDEWRSLDDVV